MSSYLKLFRWKNLLIIALTQYLLRFCIIRPVYQIENVNLQMREFDFLLLVLSTILIAAAGYIINDYFDLKIDAVNKPDKIILDKYISVKRANLIYLTFNIIAVIIGFYLGYRVGALKLGFINLLSVFLLWFYSFRYKRLFLWGNIVVAFLSALVIVVVYLFEFFALCSNPMMFIDVSGNMKMINVFVFSYAIFAFLISVIREIIKDIEDINGDVKAGCKTMPIIIGVKKTKKIVIGLILISMLALAYGQIALYHKNLMFVFLYLTFAVQVPFIYLLFTFYKSEDKKEFHLSSSFCKIIMLAGILSMQIVSINI